MSVIRGPLSRAVVAGCLILAVGVGIALAQAGGGTAGLLVKKVASMPRIDGDPSDEAWKSALALTSSNTSLKAVYTDQEIAFLFTVQDPTASISSPGNWYRSGGRWVRWIDYRQAVGDPAYRSWEMYNLVWQKDAFNLEGGCQYMCHTVEGKTRHVVPQGSSADMWSLIGKHGYGPTYMYDTGWALGYLGAFQQGPVEFVTGDSRDPYQVVSGTLSFIGWADERIQTSMGNPSFQGMAGATETGRYCLQCHDATFVERNSLQGKQGKMPYRRNGLTAPEYIKVNPVNFADASIITDLDIRDGRAVRVADLSPAEVQRIWERYEAVHALVPELILQQPSGSMADVLVGARWSNGVWTVEVRRKLVTDDPNDVQFDDLTRSYVASTAVSFGVPNGRVSGGFGSDVGLEVRFEQKK